jgi:hypothetical protein
MYVTSYEFQVTVRYYQDAGRLDFRLDGDIHVPWCSGSISSPIDLSPGFGKLDLTHTAPCLTKLLDRFALTDLQIDASEGAAHTGDLFLRTRIYG